MMCLVSFAVNRHNSTTFVVTGSYAYGHVAVDKEKCLMMF